MFVKAKNVNTLDTAGFDGFHFIVQTRDAARCVFGIKKFARMKVQKLKRRAEQSGVRCFNNFMKKSLVAAVNSVEVTDGNRTVKSFFRARQSSKNLFHP